MSGIFSLFEEPGGSAKILLGALFNLFPIARIFFIGYCGRFALGSLEGDFALPEWRNLQELFGEGWRIALAGLLLFAPSILLLGMALLFLIWPSHGSGAVYSGHLLGVLFFFSLALFAGIFSFLGFPACFFRWVESHEIFWAVQWEGIVQDVLGMGFPYWKDIVVFGGGFFLAECLLGAVAWPFFLFPWGWIFGILFFAGSSAYLLTTLQLAYIRLNVPVFRDLPYRY